MRVRVKVRVKVRFRVRVWVCGTTPALTLTPNPTQRHRFLTVRDLDWHWFNAVSFGIGGGDELRGAIARMEEALAAAKAFAKADGWSSNVRPAG